MAKRERKVEVHGACWGGGRAVLSHGTWALCAPVGPFCIWDHRSCFSFLLSIKHLDQNQLEGGKGFCSLVVHPSQQFQVTLCRCGKSRQEFKAGLPVISHSIPVQPRNSLHSPEVQQEPRRCHLSAGLCSACFLLGFKATA